MYIETQHILEREYIWRRTSLIDFLGSTFFYCLRVLVPNGKPRMPALNERFPNENKTNRAWFYQDSEVKGLPSKSERHSTRNSNALNHNLKLLPMHIQARAHTQSYINNRFCSINFKLFS